MANTFLNNFLVPLIQIILILGFFSFVLSWFTVIFIRAWKKNLKYILKYTIFRNKFKESDVEWIIKAMAKGMDYVDVKKILLVSGQKVERTNELIWIFNKINKEMQKGGQDGRPSKEYNRKNQSTANLPEVTSSSQEA